MRRFSALVTSGVLVLAASCGGGSERLSDEEFVAEAARIAESVLITSDDFPAGWNASPPDGDDDDDDEFTEEELAGLSDECRGLIEVFEEAEGDTFIEAVVEQESDTFDDGSENELSFGVEIYRDEDQVNEAWDMLDQFIEECGDDFSDTFQDLISAEIEKDPETAGILGGLEADFEFELVDDLGDRAIRLGGEMRFEVFGIPYVMEFSSTWIQVGRIFVAVEVTDLSGIDDDLVTHLTQLSLDRARSADDDLPE